MLRIVFKIYPQHLESKFGQSFAAKKQAIKSHILDVLARTSVPSSEIQHSSTVDDSPQGGIQRGDSAPDNQAELHHKAAGIRKRPRKDDKSGIIQASELVARAAVVQYTKPGEALDTQKSDSGAVAASKVPATTLPLVLPRTNQRGSKATILVQADRQDEAIDLSGDVGAVGRMTTSSSGVILDLQGHRYAGNFVPCHSYLVVSLGMYPMVAALRTRTFAPLRQVQAKPKLSTFAKNLCNLSTWRT